MEMDSSRRSVMDRSREPGLKKPRLAAEEAVRDRGSNGISSDRDRPFPVGTGRASQSSLNARFRASEREREREDREDSMRAPGSYQQQQQELVVQYKTALAELTFNSKPIITNLTIIAGENLHAAKGIAATICNNVLEVPSEQKLPSLYLLDSIVKNIGRDYIKCFAARLPEVFCKAFKQVDSSIHPGMRHLFGTWKGVFPPAPLQIIEKELGFSPIINGSVGSTVSRPDSQTQRPTHSIHVNPKYLEARQRLQQSTRAKEISSDEVSGTVTLTDDADRSDRTAFPGSTRQWTDMPNKMPNFQRPQREQSNDHVHEKKGFRDVRDHEFSSEISRQSDQGAGRIGERIKEQDELDKPYYAGSTASETAARRNGFDANHAYGNYRASGFAQADRQLPTIHVGDTNKSSHLTPKNWKNSEEEEYMWDDMTSKLTDYGRTNSSIKGGLNIDSIDKPASLKRHPWMPLETAHIDFHQDKLDTATLLKASREEDRVPLFRNIDEHHPQPRNQQDIDPRTLETSADPLSIRQAASGHQTSSLWPQREPLLSVVGLNKISRVSGQSDAQTISASVGLSTNMMSSLPKPGLLSHSHPSSLSPFTNAIPESSAMFGKQRQPVQPPSPPAHSPPPFVHLQHQKVHNSVDKDQQQPPFSQMDQIPLQFPGHFSRAQHASVTQDPFPSLSHTRSSQQSQTSHNLQPLTLSSQPSSASFTQSRHPPPFLYPSKPDLSAQQAQTPSQPLIQTEKPPFLSQNSETHQSYGFPKEIHSNNPVDVSAQSSTSNLLAAIMESGIIPNNSASRSQNNNIQPPLPSGPPPIQVLTTSVPLVSHSSLITPTSQGDTTAVTSPLARAVLPPLPPGPPPSSSLGSTASQKTNAAGAVPNPFSSLLNSLVAKGIISSPAKESPVVSSIQMPSKIVDQSSNFPSSTAVLVSSTAATSTILSSSANELCISKPSDPTASLSSELTTKLDDLIGIDFKPEIIRELHPLVIGSLFDDLEHQCNICGLRFQREEQLDSHLNLHASEKSELSGFDEQSQKWYSNVSDWVGGRRESSEVPLTTLLEEVVPRPPTSENCEPMVPADERQSICAFCGEPFEDFYSHERDEWMYRGTMYLNSLEGEDDTKSIDEGMGQMLIVHAKCMSSSARNTEVAEYD